MNASRGVYRFFVEEKCTHSKTKMENKLTPQLVESTDSRGG